MMASTIVTTNPGSRELINEKTPLLGLAILNERQTTQSLLGIGFLIACLLLGSFIGVYLLIVQSEDWESYTIPYIYITRTRWGAETPTHIEPLITPISEIYMTYTHTEPCEDEYECIEAVQQLQQKHIHEMNMTDIAYNFLVSPNGIIYEGRGWEAQNEMACSNNTLNVALIGDFKKEAPSHLQLEVVKLLIDECIQWKQLVPCYKFVYDSKLYLPDEMKDHLESEIPKLCGVIG